MPKHELVPIMHEEETTFIGMLKEEVIKILDDYLGENLIDILYEVSDADDVKKMMLMYKDTKSQHLQLLNIYQRVLTAEMQLKEAWFQAVYSRYMDVFRKQNPARYDAEEEKHIMNLIIGNDYYDPNISKDKIGILYKKHAKDLHETWSQSRFEVFKTYPDAPTSEQKTQYIVWSNNIIYLQRLIFSKRNILLISPPSQTNFIKFAASSAEESSAQQLLRNPLLSSLAKEIIYLFEAGYDFKIKDNEVYFVPSEKLQSLDPIAFSQELSKMSLNEYLETEKYSVSRSKINTLIKETMLVENKQYYLPDDRPIANLTPIIADDWLKNSAMHIYAEANDYNEIISLIKACDTVNEINFHITQKNHQGKTAFEVAESKNNYFSAAVLDLCKLLYLIKINDVTNIEKLLDTPRYTGTDTSNTSFQNKYITACLYASVYELWGIVSEVLNYVKNTNNVDVLAFNQRFESRTLGDYAAKAGRTEIVNLLLEQHADFSIKNSNNNSIIELAAGSNSLNILDLLINKQPELTLSLLKNIDNEGFTPILWAAHDGHWECVMKLIDAVKEQDNQIDALALNQVNNLGNTLAHYAAKAGREDIINYLLKQKADLSIRNFDNFTPRELAEQYHHGNIHKFLSTKNELENSGLKFFDHKHNRKPSTDDNFENDNKIKPHRT